MKSFGVFFLQYQMRFKSNAADTAFMSFIQNIVLSITALFVMTIGLKRFSSRTSVLTGGTLTVISYIITAYTTDIRVFYFAQGVLGGIGMAMIVPPMLAIIGVYFDKHRGLANSIFTGGGSVGGLIFAPVVVKLFEEYGYTGALLIVAGLLMNIWVGALLMRPIESYSPRKIEIVNIAEHSLNDKLLGRNDDYVDAEHKQSEENGINTNVMNPGEAEKARSYRSHIKVDNFTRMQSHNPSIADHQSLGSPLLQRVRAPSFGLRQRTLSEGYKEYRSENNIHHNRHLLKGVIDAISHSQMSLYTSVEGVCGSFVDVNIPSPKENFKQNAEIDEIEIKEKDVNDGKVTCCLNLKSCFITIVSSVLDLGLLRNPAFIAFLFMAFSMMSGVALVPIYMPTHAKDIGVSNEKIGFLISIMAAIDLVSKLTMGVIADRKWIKRSTILVIVAFTLGTMSHLMRFVNSFTTMVVFVVIAGICCGQYLSMYAVLLMEVIGPEKFKSSLGFGTLVHGTSIAVFFPVAGGLRDVTGSYVASFHLLGGLAYVAGGLAFIIPIVNKWKKSKETDVEKKT